MPVQQKELGVRAARTHAALRGALSSLVERRGLERVSVSMLCREAGVHRTTFYGHYGGVEAFAVDVFTEMIDEMAAVDVLKSHDLEAVVVSYYRTLRNMLVLLRDKRPIYRALFNAPIGSSFREALQGAMEKRLLLAMEVLRERGVEVEIQDNMSVNFIAGGLAAALELWVASDDTDDRLRSRQIFSLFPPWWPRQKQ